MPATINGIGTHYYGKSNQAYRSGECQACGAHAQLASYDTRLWFVIVFIPVIPLGRKRIIDQCPRCKRHWVSSLTAFETSKQQDISEAMDKYRQKPSPETALELHGRLLAYHHYDEAQQLRTLALSQYRESAVLHAKLASHLDQVGRPSEAMELYEKAFALQSDLPEARIGIAQRCIAQGELDKARELLKFLELPGASQLYSLGLLETLAHEYQREGRHAEVLELGKHILAEIPSAGQISGFRKFLAVSEKALNRDESVLPDRDSSMHSLLTAKSGAPAQWRRRLLGLATVAVLIAI